MCTKTSRNALVTFLRLTEFGVKNKKVAILWSTNLICFISLDPLKGCSTGFLLIYMLRAELMSLIVVNNIIWEFQMTIMGAYRKHFEFYRREHIWLSMHPTFGKLLFHDLAALTGCASWNFKRSLQKPFRRRSCKGAEAFFCRLLMFDRIFQLFPGDSHMFLPYSIGLFLRTFSIWSAYSASAPPQNKRFMVQSLGLNNPFVPF